MAEVGGRKCGHSGSGDIIFNVRTRRLGFRRLGGIKEGGTAALPQFTRQREGGCGNTAAYGTEGRKGPQPTRLREKRERREDGRPRNKGYEFMQKGVLLREIKRRMRIILQFACIIALRDNVVW